MPRRTFSFAILLFSFAALSLGFKPTLGAPFLNWDKQFHVLAANLPLGGYRSIGMIALFVSLALILTSFNGNCADRLEKFVNENVQLYYLWFVLFWMVYLSTYLKTVGTIISAAPVGWIVYPAFWVGALIFISIPILFVKEAPKHINKGYKSKFVVSK